MDKKSLKIRGLFFTTIFILFFSCGDSSDTTFVELPSESAFPEFWGVLTEAYSVFYSEPAAQEVESYGRMGDIERVIGKKIYSQRDKTLIWYQFEKGWISQNEVLIYDNPRKAKNSSNQLLK